MDGDVLDALISAGWHENRPYDTSRWMSVLVGEGFTINQLARAIWASYGGLRVRSASSREPASSLKIDPVESSSGALDEAERLERDYGENYSPIGFWSAQYPAYIAPSGRVVAAGPGIDWELGESFEAALSFIVIGQRPLKRIDQNR
jgi:SUKH-3 immunity protein